MKDLDKTAFSLEITLTHAQASQRIYQHPHTLQDTAVSRSGVKIKTSRKIYNTFVRTTTPSYIICLISTLLLLSRRHSELRSVNTRPPSYSGMNNKQQALLLSNQTEKRALLLHTVRILCFPPRLLVLLFNVPRFRFFIFTIAGKSGTRLAMLSANKDSKFTYMHN